MRVHLPFVFAVAIATSTTAAQANTLVADGITYDLSSAIINSTTEQFTLSISGINGPSDTEQGRYGVQSFAFTLPANFSSATAPGGFTAQSGGLNAGGCDNSGGFVCFSANVTPTAPPLAANSSLSLVFSLSLASGDFSNYNPDLKINWVGTNNNYDLVSQALAPTLATTPLPAGLPLFAGGLGFMAMLKRRRARKSARQP